MNTLEYLWLDGMSCELIRSNRKTIAIQITPEGQVTVRAPQRCNKAQINQFVMEKRDWILRKQEELRERRRIQRETEKLQPVLSDAERQRYRKQAGIAIAKKVEAYANIMGVSYGKITIRDQKTRWGSCSTRGNLNFNWRLILAPEEVLTYVVVHELAHLKEMNHSRRFWSQVASVMPEYEKHRLWLKANGDALMKR